MIWKMLHSTMFFYKYDFVQGVFFLQMLRARKQAIS